MSTTASLTSTVPTLPIYNDKTVVSPSSSASIPFPAATPPISTNNGSSAKEDAKRSQFKSLAGQFACYVAISTFTASLVVGFLSFARALVDMPPLSPLALVRSSFEIGVALGMASIGLHLGVIIVGIRAGALCIRRTAMPQDGDLERGESGNQHFDSDLGDPLESLRAKDFYRYIRYCERLQLLGTLFFIATLIYMSFLMFNDGFWPWVLLGAAAIGLVTLLYAGVWKMSVIWESVELATRWFGIQFTRRKANVATSPRSAS